MNKRLFTQLLSDSNFSELFITELGWNRPQGQTELPAVAIDDCEYHITAVAQRSGFQTLTAEVSEIPTQAACRKLDGKLRRQANDYILILTIPQSQHQCWVCPVKQGEKREIVLVEYADFSKIDFLFAKLDGLEFDYDEVTTIIDVRERVQHAFAVNSEKITKDFYTGFRKEHKAFASFICGIDEDKDKQWYTSVMLNRLMFCYFIQKKGFLNGDVDYLSNKLREVRQAEGDNKFYRSFYLDFLVSLFHDGLNNPRHTPQWEQRYGRIPYLNGGMFDIHQLEQQYAGIDIPDQAFEQLFDFFDRWQWHLDTRITATGKDINPDVLGYIFEQYINDRSAMGAYYTKEDITEYISKNCILPYLFDRVAESSSRDCFKPTGYVWQTLRESGDRYIYDAVKKGYTDNWAELIPENIAVGLSTTEPNLLDRRKNWNTPTTEQFALPTEIWRETIERLKRCSEVNRKIAAGEITAINDFITYNLNIRLFAEDLLARTTDHRFVANFYHALQKVTILDPTCGSGAFLFAAMGILEPLYEICIQRMEEFHSQKETLFVKELGEIKLKYRSNIQYFIYKSIILRNLYGVDIMVEATEIAKLRLFLKMVAVVEVDRRADNMGLDPLPDIDFNIRCGNTLVGYATEKEMMESVVYGDMFAKQEFKEKIYREMQIVATAYNTFKQLQMVQDDDMAAFKQAKQQLRERLASLNDILNHHMYGAVEHGDYNEWLASHQPFHWLAEFYDIIQGNGGFDVIIGNPPYVEYNTVNTYSIQEYNNYESLGCGNLYAYVLERADKISQSRGIIGQIVPVSIVSTPGYKTIRNIYVKNHSTYFSTYNIHPCCLFEGAHPRLSIIITSKNTSNECVYVSKYHKWYTDERRTLFDKIQYSVLDNHLIKDSVEHSLPKFGLDIISRIVDKVHKDKIAISNFFESKYSGGSVFYYRRAFGAFILFYDRVPLMYDETDEIMEPTEMKVLKFKHSVGNYILPLYHSTLFYLYTYIFSDCRNINKPEIEKICINYDNMTESNKQMLSFLSQKLSEDLQANSVFMDYNYRTGRRRFQAFFPRLSKPIIDEIDKVLAKHYGFTDEELDFIINYDIKYRMGDELNTEEE